MGRAGPSARGQLSGLNRTRCAAKSCSAAAEITVVEHAITVPRHPAIQRRKVDLVTLGVGETATAIAADAREGTGAKTYRKPGELGGRDGVNVWAGRHSPEQPFSLMAVFGMDAKPRGSPSPSSLWSLSCAVS